MQQIVILNVNFNKNVFVKRLGNNKSIKPLYDHLIQSTSILPLSSLWKKAFEVVFII